MLCAEISESRMATNARPVGAAQQVEHAEDDDREERERQVVQLPFLVQPDAEEVDRAQRRCRELPRVTDSQRVSTSCTMKPKAIVAITR